MLNSAATNRTSGGSHSWVLRQGAKGMWWKSHLCPSMPRARCLFQCYNSALQVFWIDVFCQLACNNIWLELWTFHFYRIDLESDRGFLEEGSRKLTFWIYLISRTVFNIFMKTSYNIAVLLQISAFYFPRSWRSQKNTFNMSYLKFLIFNLYFIS